MMDIITNSAKREFLEVISSISKTPESWSGWHGLQIKLPDFSEEGLQEAILWARSVVESYLENVEGKAYFTVGDNIHIICRNVPLSILEQAGHHICDYIFYEHNLISEYHIFDLFRHGQDYYLKSGVCDQSDMHIDVRQSSEHFSQDPDYRCLDVFQLEEKISVDLQDCERAKVMLVEDDPVTRWMVRNALKQSCEFATATCANKAYPLFSSFQPDIVFLDINLPDDSGVSVLRWIMKHDPGAKVVMFSSQNSLEMISETLNEGASGFVAKPFLKKDLIHYIYNL